METHCCLIEVQLRTLLLGYSKHSNYHTYIFFWKEYLHACSRYCAQNYICSYPKHLLFTNYLYMLQIFIVSLIFIYMHVGKLITLCTHFCIQKGLSCHLSTLEVQFHIIYSYWQAIYIMHTFAFKREFRAIIHSFRKTIILTLWSLHWTLHHTADRKSVV